MCGIAGIVSFNGGSDKIIPDLISMSKTIRHRGPDDEGYLVVNDNQIKLYGGEDTPTDYYGSTIPYAPKSPIQNQVCNIGFLHRRLSIIDLTVSGHQPLFYNGLWITFNGEIYNYLELKTELEKLGHVFISTSDTEVIIASYIQWGSDCVNRFNGMWAFVIYNPKENKLFASRDRLGVKPFYYINNSSLFSFASEQKAFLSTSFYSKEVNVDAFIDYFVLDKYEQEAEGIYKGIMELFPGHNLSLDINTRELLVNKYFELNINNSHPKHHSDTFDSYKENIQQTLSNAIKLRLRSDVAVGSCLSGGTDSSAIVGIASALSNYKLNLFTAAMHEKDLDESNYAKEVAEKNNGNWYTVYPDADKLKQDLNDLIYSQDIPIWSTSTYAQFSVMRLAKENNTKVLLDGQGSDELFGGYPIHLVPYYTEMFKNEGIYNLLSNLNNNSLLSVVKRWLADFKLYTLPAKLQLIILRKIHPEINALPLEFESKILERLKYHRNHFFERTPGLNEFLFYETYNHRLKSYLKCEDRCSMWHSVESRTPFADDISLINLAFEIPGNYKIKKGELKSLLKESVKNHIPESVYNRKDKMGYNTPNNQWINELIKNSEFFSASNPMVDNKWILNNLPELINSKNPRLFKLLVSDVWITKKGA